MTGFIFILPCMRDKSPSCPSSFCLIPLMPDQVESGLSDFLMLTIGPWPVSPPNFPAVQHLHWSSGRCCTDPPQLFLMCPRRRRSNQERCVREFCSLFRCFRTRMLLLPVFSSFLLFNGEKISVSTFYLSSVRDCSCHSSYLRLIWWSNSPPPLVDVPPRYVVAWSPHYLYNFVFVFDKISVHGIFLFLCFPLPSVLIPLYKTSRFVMNSFCDDCAKVLFTILAPSFVLSFFFGCWIHRCSFSVVSFLAAFCASVCYTHLSQW